jgi:hypothetical protein
MSGAEAGVNGLYQARRMQASLPLRAGVARNPKTRDDQLAVSHSVHMSRHRWERIALAAALAVGLGSACSSGNGSEGPIGNTAAAPGVGGANASGSGNLGGQSGMTAQGGNGQPGGGTANGGTKGSAGTSTSGAAGSGASSGGIPGGTGGTAGTSSGGSPSGGATSVADGGCCQAADCQPNDVKTCVCTQWGQSQCCGDAGTWDVICQTTAEEKCNAAKCITMTGPPPGPTPDGGELIKGACCATHATAGCNDKAIEQCICALVPDCCAKQWDDPCAQLVREQHCAPTVRDCVCNTWEPDCCNNAWTNSCNLVATGQCHATSVCP